MIDLRRYKLPLLLFTIIAVLIGTDQFVGHLQKSKLEEKAAHKHKNERLAYYLERTLERLLAIKTVDIIPAGSALNKYTARGV